MDKVDKAIETIKQISDRLLSEQEIYGEIATIKTDSMVGIMIPLLKAQDLKTNKWWVERIEKDSNTDAGWVVINPARWQTIKKEAGL
jgi:hypothetical protein